MSMADFFAFETFDYDQYWCSSESNRKAAHERQTYRRKCEYATEQYDRLEQKTWMTADRKTIPVKEMTDHHIQCCLNRLIKSKWVLAEKWINVFEAEQRRRLLEDFQ